MTRFQRLKDGFSRFAPAYVLLFVAFACGAIDSFRYDMGPVYATSKSVGRTLLGGEIAGNVLLSLTFGCIVAAVVSVVFRLWQEQAEQSAQAAQSVQSTAKVLRSPLALWVASLVVAASFTIAHFVSLSVGDGSSSVLVQMVGMGVFAASSALGLWLLYTSENERLIAGFAIKCFAFAGFVATVVQIGLFVCVFCWELLFSAPFIAPFSVTLLFSWLVVFPSLLFAMLPRRGDDLSFSKLYTVLVEYVSFPLFAVLLLTLYAYTVSVVVKGEMPVGEFGWFGSLAFLAYFLFWICLNVRDDKVSTLFVRWGWALMVPVAIMQGLGLFIRIEAYGFTPLRYLAFALYIVELGIIVLNAIKLKPRVIFACLSVAFLVLSITPLNPYDITVVSQSARLQAMLEQEGMIAADGGVQAPAIAPTRDRQREIISSYEVLGENPSLYLTTAYAQSARKGVRDGRINFSNLFDSAPARSDWGELEEGQTIRLRAERESDIISVSGYSKMTDCTLRSNVAERTVVLTKLEDSTEVSVDFADLIELCKQIGGDSTTVVLSPEEARLDAGNGNVFVVSSFSAVYSYIDGRQVLTNINAQGQLLML